MPQASFATNWILDMFSKYLLQIFQAQKSLFIYKFVLAASSFIFEWKSYIINIT